MRTLLRACVLLGGFLLAPACGPGSAEKSASLDSSLGQGDVVLGGELTGFDAQGNIVGWFDVDVVSGRGFDGNAYVTIDDTPLVDGPPGGPTDAAGHPIGLTIGVHTRARYTVSLPAYLYPEIFDGELHDFELYLDDPFPGGASAPPPAPTTCSTICEKGGNKACFGVGAATSDCDHCCSYREVSCVTAARTDGQASCCTAACGSGETVVFDSRWYEKAGTSFPSDMTAPSSTKSSVTYCAGFTDARTPVTFFARCYE